MLPPLLLDVQPQHVVLDMCAAPGSKTTQLIEALHAEGDVLPAGMVMANDSDNKRCYMLVHRLKPLASPNFFVSNMDALLFPILRTKDGLGRMKYDRILCDVPCSSDGTLRKNDDMWRSWSPMMGNGLHRTQRSLLMKGLRLLKMGGLICYSTCSLNPIEDESIVSEVLRTHRGSVELVDVSDKLPTLKRRPGTTTWKIMSKSGDIYEKYADVPEKEHSLFKEFMFPPTAEELEWMHLERCLRILPHLQNTGGFFVAVFRKTGPVSNNEKRELELEQKLRAEAADAEHDSSAAAAADGGAAAMDEEESSSVKDGDKDGGKDLPDELGKAKGKRFQGYKEDPFWMINSKDEDPNLKEIAEFFGLRDDFPFHLLVTRGKDREQSPRSYNIVSKFVRDILESKDLEHIKTISASMRLFSRSEAHDATIRYRIVQDSVDFVTPYMTKRVLRATHEDIVALLRNDMCELANMSESFRAQADIDTGCAVVEFDPAAFPGSDITCKVRVTVLLSRAVIRAMAARPDRAHLLILLDVPDGIEEFAELAAKKRVESIKVRPRGGKKAEKKQRRAQAAAERKKAAK